MSDNNDGALQRSPTDCGTGAAQTFRGSGSEELVAEVSDPDRRLVPEWTRVHIDGNHFDAFTQDDAGLDVAPAVSETGHIKIRASVGGVDGRPLGVLRTQLSLETARELAAQILTAADIADEETALEWEYPPAPEEVDG